MERNRHIPEEVIPQQEKVNDYFGIYLDPGKHEIKEPVPATEEVVVFEPAPTERGGYTPSGVRTFGIYFDGD